ncbi:MAG: hypothetical protein AABX14_04365 [Candidatus Aenigmatarchaeota archaeon]
MVNELEKLSEPERTEFLQLYRTPPHEMTEEGCARLDYFASRIDINRYEFQLRREQAGKPHDTIFQVMSREPYTIRLMEGEFEIPAELVPTELTCLPSEDYVADWAFAKIAIDLDTGRITHFRFNSYLERSVDESSIASIDDAPIGDWPKIK